MLKWILWLCLAAWLGAEMRADPSSAAAAAAPAGLAFDPVEHWEADFESGILWRVTGSATPLSYVLQPQILSLKAPALIVRPLGGGDFVLRSRYSVLIEPIVVGPEHHYFGLSASGSLEWWDRKRTRNLFFSSGGGLGEMDSKGHEIAGAQGEDFNFNWFAYAGARFRTAENWSVSLGAYFQHISNGHLNKIDPGVTSLGPMLSVGWHF